MKQSFNIELRDLQQSSVVAKFGRICAVGRFVLLDGLHVWTVCVVGRFAHLDGLRCWTVCGGQGYISQCLHND